MLAGQKAERSVPVKFTICILDWMITLLLCLRADSVSSSATEAAPSVFFFTRRINDPTLIPSLLAAGVKFAAIQVCCWLPLLHHIALAESC